MTKKQRKPRAPRKTPAQRKRSAARRALSTHRIQLHDELPTIGSGWRNLHLITLGWKWAHVTEASSGITARLPVKTWDQIIAGSEKRRLRNGEAQP